MAVDSIGATARIDFAVEALRQSLVQEQAAAVQLVRAAKVNRLADQPAAGSGDPQRGRQVDITA